MAKSSSARAVKQLIDPSSAPLRPIPRDDRDFAIAAANSYLLIYDNLSGVPIWVSDALCRLATGGGYATRALYSDSEECIFDSMRPIVLTGIDDLASRGDLAERVLTMKLAPISEDHRVPESEYWARFGKAAPRILGALLDALSGGIREESRPRPTRLPRMADYATWGAAIERALEWPTGSFASAYARNRGELALLTIDAAPAIGAMMSWLPTVGGSWEGTAIELLAILGGRVTDAARRDKTWPATPRGLSAVLRATAPALRTAGVEVTFLRSSDRAHARVIHIEPVSEVDPGREEQPPPGPPPEEDVPDFMTGAAYAEAEARAYQEQRRAAGRETR